MATSTTITEVVAAFDNRDALEKAIMALHEAGFDRSQVSLLASQETVESKLGQKLESTAELRHESEAPRQATHDRADVGNAMGVIASVPAYLGAVLAAGVVAASGGTLLGVGIAALAVGGGAGAVGAMFAKGLDDRVRDQFAAQIERGGILLWVSLRERSSEAKARGILDNHGGRLIETHERPA